MTKHLIILGTLGIPARHGGFETFAEKLALDLKQHDWDVTVFGQDRDQDDTTWNGIRCINFKRRHAEKTTGFDTFLYHLKCVWHARRMKGIILNLGYMHFGLNILLLGRKQIVHMDGLEHKRAKYRWPHEKLWLRFSQWCALKFAHLCIADHIEIANYLKQKSPRTPLVTLSYGADYLDIEELDDTVLDHYHLQPYAYGLIVARAEPENQIADMIHAWKKSHAPYPLVIVGRYRRDKPYQNYILSLADPRIKMIGPVYDHQALHMLRHYAGVYLHGHSIGGTNPSLIEAMASRCPIIAHDNKFNRITTGDQTLYFETGRDLSMKIDQVLQNQDMARELGNKARAWQDAHYRWEPILKAYRAVFEKLI
jgi:glycosyltransferase involved in cell wall biosynthesis